MAITYLNPASNTTTDGWDSSYSTTASHLSQGETSNTWRTNRGATGKAIWQLDDFDNTGVTSINSIQLIVVCGLDAKSGTATISTKIRDSSNSTLYSEDITNSVGGYTTHSLTLRTTSDGSSAWTDSDLDGLTLFFICTGGPFSHILQQAYIKVSYSTGYGNSVSGVASTNISNISGVASADISNVIGV